MRNRGTSKRRPQRKTPRPKGKKRGEESSKPEQNPEDPSTNATQPSADPCDERSSGFLELADNTPAVSATCKCDVCGKSCTVGKDAQMSENQATKTDPNACKKCRSCAEKYPHGKKHIIQDSVKPTKTGKGNIDKTSSHIDIEGLFARALVMNPEKQQEVKSISKKQGVINQQPRRSVQRVPTNPGVREAVERYRKYRGADISEFDFDTTFRAHHNCIFDTAVGSEEETLNFGDYIVLFVSLIETHLPADSTVFTHAMKLFQASKNWWKDTKAKPVSRKSVDGDRFVSNDETVHLLAKIYHYYEGLLNVKIYSGNVKEQCHENLRISNETQQSKKTEIIKYFRIVFVGRWLAKMRAIHVGIDDDCGYSHTERIIASFECWYLFHNDNGKGKRMWDLYEQYKVGKSNLKARELELIKKNINMIVGGGQSQTVRQLLEP